MNPTRRAVMALAVSLLATSAWAQAPDNPPTAESLRAPYHFESSGQARINGQKVHYRAVVEETFATDAGGQHTASLVITSYFKDGASGAEGRPVIFVFNGGPGSAGLWLQMGLIGPRRIDFEDAVNPPTVPPWRLVDNEESLLDVADVVIFDPPGTGYSRVLPAGKPDDFYGTRQDARLTLDFVRDWIRRHGRFNSPRFLLGESYGTIRAAVVAKLMAGGPFGSGGMEAITLNGVILLGQAMGGDVGEAALANTLPSLAATAWYHDKVDRAGRSIDQLLADAQRFAATDYVEALYAGNRLTEEQRSGIAQRIAGLTGLTPEFVLDKNLRISADTFAHTLLEEQGMQVGAYDSRFVLPLAASGNDPVADDPAMGQYVPGFVAALNLHMSNELGVKIDEPYLPIEFHEVNGRWDYGSGPGVPRMEDHAGELAVAMRRNPSLRLFVGTGWYDLVTTVGSAQYMVAHAGFPPERVTMESYESGHMPYLGDDSRKRLSADLHRFITRASAP